MKKITVLLPLDDSNAHIEAVCDGTTKFRTEHPTLSEWGDIPVSRYHHKNIYLSENKTKKRQFNTDDNIIGHLLILPARDNSVIAFVPHSPNEEIFDEFYSTAIIYFQDLNLLVETRSEPWRKSPPEKRERDKTIWECRNLGETWERTAELANCGVTTAKERYFQMQRSLDDG